MVTFNDSSRTLVKLFAEIDFAPAAMARVPFGTRVMVSNAPPHPFSGAVFTMQPDGLGGRAWKQQVGESLMRLDGWITTGFGPPPDAQPLNRWFIVNAFITIAGRIGRIISMGATTGIPVVGAPLTVVSFLSGAPTGVSVTIPIGETSAVVNGVSIPYLPTDTFGMGYITPAGFDITDQTLQDSWILLAVAP